MSFLDDIGSAIGDVVGGVGDVISDVAPGLSDIISGFIPGAGFVTAGAKILGSVFGGTHEGGAYKPATSSRAARRRSRLSSSNLPSNSSSSTGGFVSVTVNGRPTRVSRAQYARMVAARTKRQRAAVVASRGTGQIARTDYSQVQSVRNAVPIANPASSSGIPTLYVPQVIPDDVASVILTAGNASATRLIQPWIGPGPRMVFDA